MNTCCDYGKCTNGPDCPVRKQRLKEINDAYANGFKDAQLNDPLDDMAETFKALLTMVTVVLCGWIAFLLFWGK
jgi:hypothetical protein